jgi:hypothetical protein
VVKFFPHGATESRPLTLPPSFVRLIRLRGFLSSLNAEKEKLAIHFIQVMLSIVIVNIQNLILC